MKIACITLVRDECDIIELFFRNNVKVIDHFFIIHNDSCDATQEILDRLIKEGLPITVHQDKNQNYDQSTLTTYAMHNISKSNEYDWYCFLDADEFLLHDRQHLETVLADARLKVSAHEGKLAMPIVRVPWQTVVPASPGIYKTIKNEKAPTHNNCKIIIPKELSKYVINMGAHGLAAWKEPWPIVEFLTPDLKITHLPIRSEAQALTKIILSASRIKRNTHQKISHLTQQLDYTRSKNYKLDVKDLHYLAAIYNADPEKVKLGEEINLNWSEVKHKELLEINIIKRLDYQLSL